MSAHPSLFPTSAPVAPVAPTPPKPAEPLPTYSPVGGIRSLRAYTAEALSRLPSRPRPSAPSSAAQPRPVFLGMTTHREPLTEPAQRLLERVRAAGLAGYRLQNHDPAELLASYDLYRRGAILECGDWTYRATRAS